MATRVHPHSINGDLMRRLRKRAGISQERLAAQVGTTRRHMIRLENGEHLPSSALRDRIAEAVGDKRREIQAVEDDDEEAALPLNSDEFALLGDLMARLGASIHVPVDGGVKA